MSNIELSVRRSINSRNAWDDYVNPWANWQNHNPWTEWSNINQPDPPVWDNWNDGYWYNDGSLTNKVGDWDGLGDWFDMSSASDCWADVGSGWNNWTDAEPGEWDNWENVSTVI